MLFVFLSLGGQLTAQTSMLKKTVHIRSSSGTVESILSEISNAGGFVFSFGQDILHNKQVSLKHDEQTVQDFLDEIFGESIYCIEYGNKLLLKRKPSQEQALIITGKVIESATREPLPGVTIYIPGSDPLVGVISDNQGNFRIRIPEGMDMVKFSCIGYEQQLLMPGKTIPDYIEMDPRNEEIAEVVIEYFSIPVDKDINFAVGSITSRELEQLSVPTIENALQGTVAGIYTVRNTGMPGASLQVKIRGNHSLINSDPIYYLNGIPIQRAALNAVSPKDIESLEIIKDAAGTSIYGSSAGNGIVLLKSKIAAEKKFAASLNYSGGFQQLIKEYNLMNTKEFKDFCFLVKRDTLRFNNLDTLYQTDWLNEIFHNAPTEDLNFSFSGRNEHSGVYFSAGYFHQNAMIKNLNFKRYSFNLVADHQITPRLSLMENLSFSSLKYNGVKEGSFLSDYSNPILSSLLMLPYYQPNDSVPPPLLASSISLPDPSDDAELSGNSRKNYVFHGNFKINYEISSKIHYSANFGLETLYQNNISYNNSPPIFIVGPDFNFYKNEYQIRDLAWNTRHTLDYNAVSTENQNLNFQVAYESGQNTSDWIPLRQTFFESRQAFYDDSTGVLIDYYSKLRFKSDFRHSGISGSFAYNFKSKYYLNASVRQDFVSYPFNDERKELTSIYPAASAGWIFTREEIFSKLRFLRYGKIRFSWGQSGNSPRLDYTHYANMMQELDYLFAFNSKRGISNSALLRQSNEHFYWEKKKSIDMGIDLGLFNNRLFLSADCFLDHLDNGQTYPVDNPLPFISELSQRRFYRINYTPTAEILNKGVEADLKYILSFSSGSIEFGGNISHIKNTIIEVSELPISYLNNPDYDVISGNIPGEAVGSFYGYKIERLFVEEDVNIHNYITNHPLSVVQTSAGIYTQTAAKPGDYKYLDVNKDSIINYEDKVVLGNPFPKFTFGFYSRAGFRNFDLFLFFQGSYGNDIFNATKFWLFNPYGQTNWSREMMNSYRSPKYDDGVLIDPGNTDTDLHRYDISNLNHNLRVSDFYIEDGSYLRLKNIEIGYTLDPSISKKIHIQKCRIYLSARNLLTFTNYTGLDPEVGGWGVDCGFYPQPRTYMAGVNLEF